jgi:GNAT superfamily N-acetyltransferase
MLASMGYRRVGWYVHSLHDPINPVEPRTTLEFAELSKEDVGRYLLFRRGAREKDILARLAAGNRCYAALCNGEIASVSWIAEKQGYLELIGYRFPLEPDEIYVFDSFTAKKYRGKRIHSALYSRLLQHYKTTGYRAVISLIVPENRSNITARTRTGFKQTGSVLRLKLGPFCRYHFRGECRPPAPESSKP